MGKKLHEAQSVKGYAFVQLQVHTFISSLICPCVCMHLCIDLGSNRLG